MIIFYWLEVRREKKGEREREGLNDGGRRKYVWREGGWFW